MLAGSVIFISLLIMLMFSYEWLAVKFANQYLSQYDARITEIRLSPRSLTHWQLPTLDLVIKDSHIRIQDLEFTFDNPFSLLHFTADQLTSISLGKIAVVLNPNVLSDTGKNLDEQGPTLVLDITQLPQIEIGQTFISLKGIPSNVLSLNLTHLILDKFGHLTSKLIHQGEPLLSLDAQLNDKKWSISSTIVLAQLHKLLNTIAKQDLAHGALSSVLAMKKKLDELGINFIGTLNSQAELDLTTAQLRSVHQLTQTPLTLPQLAGLTLVPNTQLAQTPPLISKGLLTHIHSKPNQILKFKISGHITDLSLTISPFSVQVTPKHQQNIALLTLTKHKVLHKMIELLQTTQSNEALNQLTMTISLREPLNFSFSAQEIRSPDITLSVVNNTISAIISLKELSLALPHDFHSLTLNANWSFNLATKTRLALQPLLPNRLSSLELNLANTAITTKGKLQLKLVDNTHDGVTQTDPIFTLSVDDDARIISDELTLHTDPDPQQSMIMKMVSLSSHTKLHASYSSGTLSVVLPSFTAAIGPVTYHYQPSSKSKKIEFEANHLTFHTSDPSDFNAKINSAGSPQLAPKCIQLTGSRFSLKAEQVTFLETPIGKHDPFTPDSISIATKEVKFSSSTPLSIGHCQDHKTRLTLALPKFEYQQTDTEFIQVTKDLSHVQGKGPVQAKIPTKKAPFSAPSHQELITKLPYFALTVLDSTNLTFTLDKNSHWPQALSQTAWKNQASYQIEGLALTRRYHKNKRFSTEKLLQLNQATVEQTFNWNKHTLTSQEAWSFDELDLNSTHQITLDLTQPSLQTISVQGEVTLDTELSKILAIVDVSYPLPAAFYANGHAEFSAKYRSTPASTSSTQKSRLLTVDFTPTLTDISGNINELPFEKARLNAKCKLTLHRNGDSQKAQSALSCDQINLSARAFNPGVLIEDFDSHASLFISLNSEQKKQRLSSSVPANLTHADIQMNASGKLLGGEFILPEFNLKLQERSHGYLVLQGVNLAEVIAIQPQIGLYADGILDGVLPIDLVNGKVSVSGGRLATRAPGGLIALKGNPAVDQMRGSQAYLDFAFSTIEHLEYSELSSRFDMESTGDAILHLNVKGQGKGIERPIHLNYSQEENMLQLLRSLQISDKLQTQIEQSINIKTE